MEMNTNTTTFKTTDTEMNWCKETMNAARTCATNCRNFADKTNNFGWKMMFNSFACCFDGCCAAIQKCMDYAAKHSQ